MVALESTVLGSTKKTLGCSAGVCHEAVRRDVGLDIVRIGSQVKVVV